MSSPSFAPDTPSHPFDSQIGDDSPIESEVLLALCEKTLIESNIVILATSSLISDIYEALNAPLNGESMSESESPLSNSLCASLFDSSFEDSQMLEAESDIPLFDSSSDVSMVPETEFEDLPAIHPDPGATEASGGDRWTSTAEPVAVMAEQMESGMPPVPPSVEAMLRILLPAYFILVRSFPICLLWLDLGNMLHLYLCLRSALVCCCYEFLWEYVADY